VTAATITVTIRSMVARGCTPGADGFTRWTP
jgi:hypothetical protein